MRKYPINYKDKFGKEKTEITTDGSTMYLTMRGIKFKGVDFESLEGAIETNKFQYEMYQDGSGVLTNFRMEIELSVKLHHKNKTVFSKIKFNIGVGNKLKIETPKDTVELETPFGRFKSQKKIEYFEGSIIEIQKMLPSNTQLIICLSCKYSNYHPVGNGMFGALYCFKQMKNKVANVNNKHDLMNLWTEEAVLNNHIFNVHEVFDCAEHKFITKHDWTYKDWDYKTNHTDKT